MCFPLFLISSGEIDDVFQRLAGQEMTQVGSGNADDVVVRSLQMVSARYVRRNVKPRRVPHRAVCRQRLRLRHVDGSAGQVPAADSGAQIVLHDVAAPADVDK